MVGIRAQKISDQVALFIVGLSKALSPSSCVRGISVLNSTLWVVFCCCFLFCEDDGTRGRKRWMAGDEEMKNLKAQFTEQW